MPLDETQVGSTSACLSHAYDWKDVVLYALSVGAQPSELDFLFEERGPRVLPTYGVIPAMTTCEHLLNHLGGDLSGLVHAGQRMTLHRPLSSTGTLSTTGKVNAIYDLKRLAQVTLETSSKDAEGHTVCETEMELLFRFDGGFGGKPPPRRPPIRTPDAPPEWEFQQKIPDTQAYLYRLNGDLNPLHADPAVAQKVGFDRPILHGLCTFGYLGRAVLEHACAFDPARLKTLGAQFRKPVFPGDTLLVQGWKLHDDDRGSHVMRVVVADRPDQPVLTHALAGVLDPGEAA